MENKAHWLSHYIVTVQDFPKSGVHFKSIAPLLKNPEAFARAIRELADHYKNQPIDALVALDARGFIFGGALAYAMKLPLIMARKAGKLPGPVITIDYNDEYANATFEMEKNSIASGQRILIVDDVLATGGSVRAVAQLVKQLGGKVIGLACIFELAYLKGREKLDFPVFSLLSFDKE